MPTNPNGANQFILDPRQKACWEYYINPESETFGNATQSAIKAGYTKNTADHITGFDWFRGKKRRYDLRQKAENVLEEILNMPVEQPVIKDGVLLGMKISPALIRIKQDTAKFAAERLGKDDWSSRQELTGANGDPLVADEQRSKATAALDSYLHDDQGNT